jgi:hypothetical protein
LNILGTRMEASVLFPRTGVLQHKYSCSPCSSIADDQKTKALFNKRTTVGCSDSSTCGSVAKPLWHLVCQVGWLGVSLEAVLLLLHIVVPMITLWPHSLRLKVAVVQQQLHLLCAPMWVHSHSWVRAPAAAQPWRNEQALPVERLCKFYRLDDMSESVPIYITQGFYTVNQTCLPCSLFSLVSRNRSGTAKPRWVLNGLRFSAAISARRWWVIVSIYVLSSPMWCHIFGFGYLILYLRLFKAPLFFHLRVFASLLSGFLLFFMPERIGLRQVVR